MGQHICGKSCEDLCGTSFSACKSSTPCPTPGEETALFDALRADKVLEDIIEDCNTKRADSTALHMIHACCAEQVDRQEIRLK